MDYQLHFKFPPFATLIIPRFVPKGVLSFLSLEQLRLSLYRFTLRLHYKVNESKRGFFTQLELGPPCFSLHHHHQRHRRRRRHYLHHPLPNILRRRRRRRNRREGRRATAQPPTSPRWMQGVCLSDAEIGAIPTGLSIGSGQKLC